MPAANNTGSTSVHGFSFTYANLFGDVAYGNGGDGFRFTNPSYDNSAPASCSSCISEGNGVYGFNTLNSSDAVSFLLLSSAAYDSCVHPEMSVQNDRNGCSDNSEMTVQIKLKWAFSEDRNSHRNQRVLYVHAQDCEAELVTRRFDEAIRFLTEWYQELTGEELPF